MEDPGGAEGRTYHADDCPIERWLVDASYPETPTFGEVLVAASTAGSRAGQKASYQGARQKWVVHIDS